MATALRSIFFSMVLGFHNAWTQEELTPENLGIRIVMRSPLDHPLMYPVRCFFWAESSLLN